MDAVRNRLKDFQTPGQQWHRHRGLRVCEQCLRYVKMEEHTGVVFCKKCAAEHEARILAHQQRIQQEMKRRAINRSRDV